MLRILDVTAPDINNGNGIRVTLWVAGCSHHCKGCQNAWTWEYNQGINWLDDYEKRESTLKKMYDWLGRDYVQGLTISGGDPLDQDPIALHQLCEIIQSVKEFYPTKDIWLYTGDIYEEAIKDKYKKQVIDLVDVVIDGPYVEELRDVAHTPFRGSTNQRIIKTHG